MVSIITTLHRFTEKYKFIHFLSRLIILICFLMLTPFLSAEQITVKRQVIISSIIKGDSETENKEINNLILEVIKYELNQAGLSLTESESPDILIDCVYNVTGNIIRFNLKAAVPEDDKLLFSTDSQEELQFNLDKVLIGHAGRMTGAIKDYIALNSDIFTAAKTEEMPESDNEADEKETTGNSDISDKGIQDDRSLVFYTDVGLFLAAGKAGRYFKPALWPSVFGGLKINDFITAGLNTGLMYFKAEGYAAKAQGIIFNAGPSLRIKGQSSGPFIPGIRAETGAAFLFATPENSDTSFKIIPSAETGLTIDIIRKNMNFLISTDISLFFENKSLLYGFTPRVGLYF